MKKRNYNYILVEQNKIGSQTSSHTTAFITAQHETLYQDIAKLYGLGKAKEYLDINLKAINKYKELSYIYDFDFEECESCLYSVNQEEKIIKEKEILSLIGYKTKIIDNPPLEIPLKKGIVFENQGKISISKSSTKNYKKRINK